MGSGNVGIGTTSPGVLLDVGSAGVTQGYLRLRSTTAAAEANLFALSTGGLGINTNSYAYPVVIQADTIQLGTGSTGTERARIDSSGRLLVGTTSSSGSKVEISTTTDGDGLRVLFANTPLGTTGPTVSFSNYNNSNTPINIASIKGVMTGGAVGSEAGALVFNTATGGAAPAERMRIDSSGRVGIGTTSPSTVFHVAQPGDTNGITITHVGRTGIWKWYHSGVASENFAFIQNNGTSDAVSYLMGRDVHIWYTNGGTERARIDSSGNLLHQLSDTTKATGFYTVPGETGTTPVKAFAIYEAGKASVSYQGQWRWYTSSGNGTVYKDAFYLILRNYDNGTAAESADLFQFRGNGGLANYSANNVNLSDRNEKKDITPASGTWDCLKEWEIVNYRYINAAEDSDLNLGVIAQQIKEVCPENVTVFQTAQEAKEAVFDENGNEIETAQEARPEKLGIKEQQMYWMAIKALQEAQLRIEALESSNTDLLSRIQALESK